MVLLEQLVVLSSSGVYLREINLADVSPSSFHGLDEEGRIFHYTSLYGYGYRGDAMLACVREYIDRKRIIAFSSKLASLIFMHTVWDTLSAGHDKYGRFVQYKTTRFYEDFTSRDRYGELHSLANNFEHPGRFRCRVSDIPFAFNKFTLTYLFFHNHGEFNPLLSFKEVLPRRYNVSPSCKEEAALVDYDISKRDSGLLMRVLLENNLFLRGNLSYYSLLPQQEFADDFEVEFLTPTGSTRPSTPPVTFEHLTKAFAILEKPRGPRWGKFSNTGDDDFLDLVTTQNASPPLSPTLISVPPEQEPTPSEVSPVLEVKQSDRTNKPSRTALQALGLRSFLNQQAISSDATPLASLKG